MACPPYFLECFQVRFLSGLCDVLGCLQLYDLVYVNPQCEGQYTNESDTMALKFGVRCTCPPTFVVLFVGPQSDESRILYELFLLKFPISACISCSDIRTEKIIISKTFFVFPEILMFSVRKTD